MEPSPVTEYRAECHTCNWHGRKYGSKRAAEAEIPTHIKGYENHECEVIATEVTNEHPELSKEAVKLLFIRKSAAEAYASGEIKEATKGMLIEIAEIITASSMSKEDLGVHIGNLDKARSFLAAYTQGLKMAQGDELEPIFREKREKEAKKAKEERERKASSVKPDGLSLSMQALGLSMETIMSGLAAKLASPDGNIEAVTPPDNSDDYTCPKCSKVTSKSLYSLHIC